MTSYGLIFKLNVGVAVLAVFGVVPTYAAVAMVMSWALMDVLGLFKKDKELIVAALDGAIDDDEDGVSERTKEFRRKIAEGKTAEEVIAHIVVTDKEDRDGELTIHRSGEIRVNGHISDDLRDAAEQLKASIEEHGAEGIGEEFARQLKEMTDNEKR